MKLFILDENRGFTGGIAAALAGSFSRNVVYLNNDARPEPGWLAALVAAIEGAPPDVVAVGGRIVDLSGSLIDFIGGILTFDGHALQNGFRMPIGQRAEPAAGAEILFPCGGNMIARRELLLEIGGFDDDYFAYLEDVDFGWRSWISGYRVLYEPRATVRHASSATSNRLGDFERGVLFERNAMLTALKNYEDDLMRENGFALLFAFLHRLHHYTTTRNSETAELIRPPFAGALAGPKSFLSRVSRRLRGASAAAVIDDPLTAMQFRALDWIMRNDARIAERRRAVQNRRRRSDRAIFEQFPLHFIATYPGDARLMASPLFRMLRPRVPSVDADLSDIIRT